MNTRLTTKELRRRAAGPAPARQSAAFQAWYTARKRLGLPTRRPFLRERYTPEQLRERRNRYHRKYMRTYKRKAGAVCQ